MTIGSFTRPPVAFPPANEGLLELRIFSCGAEDFGVFFSNRCFKCCFKQAVGCVLMKLPLRTISFYWPTGAKLEI